MPIYIPPLVKKVEIGKNPTKLGDLSDVFIGSATSGDGLIYDGTFWANKPIVSKSEFNAFQSSVVSTSGSLQLEIINLQNNDVSLQKQINEIVVGTKLVFNEEFTGNGVSTTAILNGDIKNGTFISGGWAAINVANTLPAYITDVNGYPIYDSNNVFTRHRINVTTIASNGTVSLDYVPQNNQKYKVWYFYSMSANDRITNYYRDDFVAKMEGEVSQTVLSTQVQVSTVAFDHILSNSDTTLQSALDTLDDHRHDYYAIASSTISGSFNNVIVNSQGVVTSGGRITYTVPSDLAPYALTSTVSGISGNLQNQINSIVQESTTIASSGGSILINKTGNAFNIEVATSPIQSHNSLSGLQGGISGQYYHLSSSQYNDFIGKSEVASVSGSILSSTANISGSLQSQITVNTNSINELSAASGGYLLKTGDTASGLLILDGGVTTNSTYYLNGNEGFGIYALGSVPSGFYNTGVGAQAGASITTGQSNTVVGANAAVLLDIGSNNTVVGASSLVHNVSGSNNVALGRASLNNIIDTSNNVGIGTDSLFSSNGSNNTAIGTSSGTLNTTGSNNIFIGFRAGYSELGSNKLIIDYDAIGNHTSSNAFIYGDLSANYLNINATTLNTKSIVSSTLIGTSGSIVLHDASGKLIDSGILITSLANKASPTAGTYNNVVVNSQGIVTSGGNLVYALDSGVVHIAGFETITGAKAFSSNVGISGTLQVNGVSTLNGYTIVNNTLYSNKYLLGADLSLLPIANSQSALSCWWGLQLVGNKQSTLDYTPTQISNAANNFGVLIPSQQTNTIALAVFGKAGQTANLTSWYSTTPGATSVVPFPVAAVLPDGTISGNGLFLASSANLLTVTPATSAASFASPSINLNGTYWTGSASGVDNWNVSQQILSGTNGQSALIINHNGSTGYTLLASNANISAGNTSNIPHQMFVGGNTTQLYSGLIVGAQAPAIAGNIYGLGVNKNGIEAIAIGVNKNSTTGSIPANWGYLSTYSPNNGIAIGLGAGNGLMNTANISILGSNNSVGINTTTPNQPLTVNGNISGNASIYVSNIYNNSLNPALSGNFITWDNTNKKIDSGFSANSFVLKSGSTMTGGLTINSISGLTLSNLVGSANAIVTHDSAGKLVDSGILITSLATAASPTSGTYNSIVVNSQGIVTSGGFIVHTSPQGTISISNGNVPTFDVVDYISKTTVANISASLLGVVNSNTYAISGTIGLQGIVTCDTVSTSYTIVHNAIDLNSVFPIVSIVGPTSGDYIGLTITNRQSNQFTVLLSAPAPTSGYSITWHLGTGLGSSTIASISGSLQSQITSNTNSINNLASVTGSYALTSTVASISGGLNTRLTTVENNYATKATPTSGTYNNVVVNSQGIVTSGGLINYVNTILAGSNVQVTQNPINTYTVSVTGNISRFVNLSSQPTPTTSGNIGDFGFYGGYLYRWIGTTTVVRSAVETSW